MKKSVFGLLVFVSICMGLQAKADEKEKGQLSAGRFKFGPYINSGIPSSITKILNLEKKLVKRVSIQTAGSGGTFDTRIVKCDGEAVDLDSLSNFKLYANSKAEQKFDPKVCGAELVIDHTPNMYSEFTVYVDVQ